METRAHLVRFFTYDKLWFSIVMLDYWKVYFMELAKNEMWIFWDMTNWQWLLGVSEIGVYDARYARYTRSIFFGTRFSQIHILLFWWGRWQIDMAPWAWFHPENTWTEIHRILLDAYPLRQAGAEYVAESSSINKSLFFLGKVRCVVLMCCTKKCEHSYNIKSFQKNLTSIAVVEVIEKLAARDKRTTSSAWDSLLLNCRTFWRKIYSWLVTCTSDVARPSLLWWSMIEVPEDNEHIPFRDSKCCPHFGQVWEAQPESTPTTKANSFALSPSEWKLSDWSAGRQPREGDWLIFVASLHACLWMPPDFKCRWPWHRPKMQLSRVWRLSASRKRQTWTQCSEMFAMCYQESIEITWENNYIIFHYISRYFLKFIARHVRSRRLRKFDVLQSPS